MREKDFINVCVDVLVCVGFKIDFLVVVAAAVVQPLISNSPPFANLLFTSSTLKHCSGCTFTVNIIEAGVSYHLKKPGYNVLIPFGTGKHEKFSCQPSAPSRRISIKDGVRRKRVTTRSPTLTSQRQHYDFSILLME